MAGNKGFDFVRRAQTSHQQLFNEFHELNTGKLVDVDIPIVTELRRLYPDLIVTTVPANNVNLLTFVAAGYATAELDTKTENLVRWRGFIPAVKRGETGGLGDAVFFAKYHYQWRREDFILYTVSNGYTTIQYILKEPAQDENPLGHSKITDALIAAIGEWLSGDKDVVYVFDGVWRADKQLWNQVQRASWDNVILDPKMKKELVDVANKFFDSEETYKQFGVPWKRGLIFYGPVGNGKTISIKALMHSLYKRKDPIPSLYVKSVNGTYQVRQIFAMARNMAPCMLIMEDMETIVYGGSRSYFFNEVDGLENNNGILMIGSTNYLEKLDPGITKRPSRFDRKYLFPLPSNDERVQYCNFWRAKVLKNPKVDFPKKLINLIAAITFGFSFAYLQEAFVATLLELARENVTGDIDASDYIDAGEIARSVQAGLENGELNNQSNVNMQDDDDDDDDDDDLEKIPFWRVMREQVSILREDLTKSESSSSEEMGVLSTPKKYWDSVFGFVSAGMSKMFSGENEPRNFSDNIGNFQEPVHAENKEYALPVLSGQSVPFGLYNWNKVQHQIRPTYTPNVFPEGSLDPRTQAPQPEVDASKFFRSRR